MLSQIPEDDYLDMFDDDDDSDSGSSDSHDDDISIVVKSDSHTTQKKIFRKKTNDEDLVTDFDKEMENELWDTVNALECVRKFKGYRNAPKTEEVSATTSSQQQKSNNDGVSVSGEGDPPSSSSVVKNEKTCEQYDDIYFDSDEELEKIDSDDKDKHPVLSNEDLFYDPDMDTKDQLWMDERRRNPHMFEYLSPQKRKNDMFKKKENNNDNDESMSDDKKRKKKPNKLNKRRAAPKSDAILDCPACMTTLCIDCQKHDTFVNQYRAMFVMNCTIDFSERFRYSNQGTGKKKKRQVTFNDEDMSSSIPLKNVDEKDDLYYSVKCDECSTKVAMYDKDEVYHFFNVISSYG